MNAKTLIFSFILSGLFMVAMLSFGFNLAIDNNATKTILNDPIINSSFIAIQFQLNNGSSSVNSSKTGFEKDSLKDNTNDIILPSIKSGGTVFFSLSTGIYNIIFGMASATLNIPPIVLTTIAILLGISIVLLAWRLYRMGQ